MLDRPFTVLCSVESIAGGNGRAPRGGDVVRVLQENDLEEWCVGIGSQGKHFLITAPDVRIKDKMFIEKKTVQDENFKLTFLRALGKKITVHVRGVPYELPDNEIAKIMSQYGDLTSTKRGKFHGTSIFNGIVHCNFNGDLWRIMPNTMRFYGHLVTIFVDGNTCFQICRKCQQNGHNEAQCTNEIVCYKCREVGHRGWTCKKDRLPTSYASLAGSMARKALAAETSDSDPDSEQDTESEDERSDISIEQSVEEEIPHTQPFPTPVNEEQVPEKWDSEVSNFINETRELSEEIENHTQQTKEILSPIRTPKKNPSPKKDGQPPQKSLKKDNMSPKTSTPSKEGAQKEAENKKASSIQKEPEGATQARQAQKCDEKEKEPLVPNTPDTPSRGTKRSGSQSPKDKKSKKSKSHSKRSSKNK